MCDGRIDVLLFHEFRVGVEARGKDGVANANRLITRYTLCWHVRDLLEKKKRWYVYIDHMCYTICHIIRWNSRGLFNIYRNEFRISTLRF